MPGSRRYSQPQMRVALSAEPDLCCLSQVRQHQQPNVDNGHCQQRRTLSGLLGNSVYSLVRLLFTLICALNIGIAAGAKTDSTG